MKKKFFSFIAFILIGIFVLLNTSLWPPIKSYVVMFFYSKIHYNDSLLNKYNIDLRIPGGLSTRNKDWYPFVMTFNDDTGFSKKMDRDVSLTILYNFGHFNIKDGSSSYYNPSSKYFSSFYGGYLVKNNDFSKPPFGFHGDGSINLKDISLVPEYDQKELVLWSLGCPEEKMKFDVSIDNIRYDVNYINHRGWVKVDSTIITNSPVHKFKNKHMAYIQYGEPPSKYYNNEDFPIITLRGRTYVKYFKDYDASIFLYVLASDIDTIEECDKNILSKITLGKDI